MRAAVGGLVAGLLLVLAGCDSPSAGGPTAPLAMSTGPAETLRVGTFNIDRERGFAAWRRAVESFRSQVDVAGLQEVSSAAKRGFLADGSWGYFGATPGPDENPVIWDRSTLRVTGARAVRIAARQAGRPAAYATLVRLQHRRTGERYAVLNVHLAFGETPAVRRYRLAEVGGLARAAAAEQEAGAVVLVVGDFNIDHRVDRRRRQPGLPVRRLGAVGLVSAWETAVPLRPVEQSSTRGRGFIDNIWAAERAASVHALTDVSGGQHHPVVATYAVPTGVQQSDQ